MHHFSASAKLLISTGLVFLMLVPFNAFSQQRDFATFQRDYSVQKEKQRGVQLLDTVRKSVKYRQEQLEEEAKKEEFFYYGNAVTNPENLGYVEQERQMLLRIVEEWSQADKKTILAIPTNQINQVITKSTAIGYYHGLDVVKLTKLYELGKDVIAGSLFELPENTHPDDTNAYDNLKRRYINKQLEVDQLAKTETFSETASRNAVQAAKNTAILAPLMYAMEGMFNTYFNVATDREVEIAEFLAEKQDYRVLLFKRVTLAYVRSLLASGEELPVCQTNQPFKTDYLRGEKVPVIGCDDPSMVYLRQYVNAIRTLQNAETDTFMAEAQNVIAEQQLAVDVASTLPLVGDAIDWYSLIYGLYAQEDLTGHCLTRLDYTMQFVAAALPFVGPKMLESAAARNPEVAKRFIVNMSELTEGLEFAFKRKLSVISLSNARRASGNAVSSLASRAGKTLSETDSILLKSLADRWGSTPETMEQFARDVQAMVKKAERSEKNAARKALKEAKELAAKKTQARMAKIMKDTVDDADSQIRALAKLQAESPEYFEKALRDAQDVFQRNVKAIQTSQEAAIKNSNMVDEHIEVIMDYMKRQANNGDNMTLIYRHVNPDSTELIRRGFFTKGMDIKGKSSDWGIQRGFIPVEQKFSKLANPSKRAGSGFSPDDIAKQEKFQGLVDKFFDKKTKTNDADRFVTNLVLDDKPVMIVKDKRLNREVTAYFDPKTGKYLDEDKLPIPTDALDLRDKRPLQVMATTNDAGEKMALTADYDLLSFGFSSEVGTPGYDDMTGYITPKQQKVLKEINQDIRNKTGYRGDVSHHGPEVQYPDSPGAFQDPLITTIDLENGVMTIPRCDENCMRKWCTSTGNCKQFGFPNTKFCAAEFPKPPCIPIDPDRLLKDYMHLRRMQGYQLFPNKNWGWGDYNPLGGWNMVNFMEAPTLLGIYDSSVRIAGNLTGALIRTKVEAQNRLYGEFLSGLQYATECPFGKRESDLIEEGI